jgi:acetyltransferase
MRTWAPPEASLRNPVDLTPQASLEDYRRALDVVLADDGVDAAIAIYVPPVRLDEVEVARAVWTTAKDRGKPVLANFLGRSEESPGFVELVGHGVPSYLFPESAARSLAAMYRYAQYRMRDEGEVRTFRVDKAAAQSILTKARGEGRLLLGEEEASALLEAYGIRTAKARVIRRIEDLASAAAQIGYPVVLKAVGPQLIHKSELQAVRVDLRGERELREAASQMADHLRQGRIAVEGFLLQEFVQGGLEVVLGMSRDKVYGPFLVFGLGGVYVEYLKDVAFGLPPLTDRDAMRMIESIRTYPMLRGVRGQPPRDLAALQDAILRLGALVADFDVLQEMDLNPILALEEGRGYRTVDARILLAPPSSPMPAIDPGTRAT